MPKFSIIIPVYNVAPYLRECLDSVLAQTFTDWEAICVDDGSTDDSCAILDEYAAKDVRFRVVHQPNRGVSAARNAGLDVAIGEWLAFLDGDDIFLPSLLDKVCTTIDAYPSVDMVRYDHFGVGEGHGLEIPGPCRVFSLEKEIGAAEMDGVALIMWGNVIRRKRVRDIRFMNYVCGEDRLYTFDCLLCSKILAVIPCRLYGYRARPLSYTTSVIATYRGWQGELAYRVKFLEKIRNARKVVHIEGAKEWLIHYLVKTHLVGFLGACNLTKEEKSKLLLQWKQSLLALAGSQVFPQWARCWFWAQHRLHLYNLVWGYCYVRFGVFGPNFILRKIYRRLRHHGEYSKKEF